MTFGDLRRGTGADADPNDNTQHSSYEILPTNIIVVKSVFYNF